MSITGTLYGSAGAPLIATRWYTFNRAASSSGEPALWISTTHRDSRDDFGSVEHREQEVFVERLLAALGVAPRGGYPGEWIFSDEQGRQRVWAALEAAIQPSARSVPSASARLDVTREEASAAANGLTPRFLALVDEVLGLGGPGFTCIESTQDSDGDQTTRVEQWRRDGMTVRIEGKAIESGHGIHGETATYVVTGRCDDPRSVSAYASIDMRSGGTLSVTVQGVLGAQALADGFVLGPG